MTAEAFAAPIWPFSLFPPDPAFLPDDHPFSHIALSPPLVSLSQTLAV